MLPKGENPPRYMWYGRTAIDNFCTTHGITRIVRGHTIATEVRASRSLYSMTFVSDAIWCRRRMRLWIGAVSGRHILPHSFLHAAL